MRVHVRVCKSVCGGCVRVCVWVGVRVYVCAVGVQVRVWG